MTTSENPNAFPSYSPDESPFNHGMTLRDWFAGQVASECIRNAICSDGGWEPANVAYHAYLVADAMLAARTSKENPA